MYVYFLIKINHSVLESINYSYPIFEKKNIKEQFLKDPEQKFYAPATFYI